MARAFPVCTFGLLFAAMLPTPARAQTVPATPPGNAPTQDDVTVTGRRLPGAEAPSWAACEALARDSHFAARLAAGRGETLARYPYAATRLPRNPDYTAPPKVPVGAPLPILPRSRFGLTSLIFNAGEASGTAEATAGSFDDAATPTFGNNSRDSAVAACRRGFVRGLGDGEGTGYIPASDDRSSSGAPHANPEFRVGAAQGRFLAGRVSIVSRDTTLPMALALFDQGRYRESLDWFDRAAHKLALHEGGDEAALFLGKLYLQGLGEDSDPKQALRWLKKAATAPYDPVTRTPMFDPLEPERNTAVGEAAVILANLYRTGFVGIAKDPRESRKWYDRARDVGHVPAAKVLGDIYYNGIDTPREVKKALAYYRRAARLNYAAAQVALADILMVGEPGVPADRKEALGWYQAAAKIGHPEALFALARAYDLGEGVKSDAQLALGFYKEAALKGHAPAQAALGTYFYEGKLVAKDHALARRWFERAAAAGDPDALFNLAAMTARGDGGAQDLPQAWAGFQQAARAGHARAPLAAAAIEKQMTPAQRTSALALLAR